MHELRRAAEIIDIYTDGSLAVPKTIEYEFGDKTSQYKKGDTLLLYNSTRRLAVTATIADFQLVQRAEPLDPKTLSAIGAKNQEELQDFIKQRGGQHVQDTLLLLDNIALVKNPHYNISSYKKR